MHKEAAVFRPAFGAEFFDFLKRRVKILQWVQQFLAHPTFRRSAAQAILDQTDGHMKAVLEFPPKKIGDSRESSIFGHGFRCADFP